MKSSCAAGDLERRLRETVRRLPDDATAEQIHKRHSRHIALALDSRGDPFARSDVIVLKPADAPELRINVRDLPATIGAAENAYCRIQGCGVSRLHCRLDPDGALVRLSDAGSKNGTYLNGRKIEKEHLRDGDRITIGTVRIAVGRG